MTLQLPGKASYGKVFALRGHAVQTLCHRMLFQVVEGSLSRVPHQVERRFISRVLLVDCISYSSSICYWLEVQSHWQMRNRQRWLSSLNAVQDLVKDARNKRGKALSFAISIGSWIVPHTLHQHLMGPGLGVPSVQCPDE